MEDVFGSPEPGIPSSPAPPPPAPAPAPATAPALTPSPLALSEIQAKVVSLQQRLIVIEKEVQEQRVFRLQATQTLSRVDAGGAAPAPAAGGGALLREVERLRAERDKALAERDAALAGGGGGGAQQALEALRLKHGQLIEQYERIEGEYQSLKLRVEGQSAAAAATHVDLGELDVSDPDVQAKLQELANQNETLRSQREELDKELRKFRKDATAKFKRLKGDLDTVAHQKQNLLKELASRDESEVGGGSQELTLEQITNSPVFKTMLGNIRRTSREEVTHLHDAIASLRKIDPAAYAAILPVVARQFENANMENPLAMLPPPE